MYRRLFFILILLLVAIVALLWWGGQPLSLVQTDKPTAMASSSSVDLTGWCCLETGAACVVSERASVCLDNAGIVFMDDQQQCDALCTSVSQ